MAAYKLSDIEHESPNHWVLRVKSGYEIYRIGITHSTRCAQIGYAGAIGLQKAIAECQRRERRLIDAALTLNKPYWSEYRRGEPL